jgi:hypothetical protein
MPATLDRVYEGLAMVFVLCFTAMFFIDRVQFQSRLTELLGKARRLPPVWRVPASDPIPGLLWFPIMALSVVDTLGPHPAAHQHVPWTLWQKAFLSMAAVVFVLLFIGGTHLKRRQRRAEELELSRGVLFDNIRRAARKIGFYRSVVPRVYVLPDVSEAPLCAQFGCAVLIPRQLLDSMGRREIDALAVWQLCRQSNQYSSPPLRALLACDVVVACLLEWLVPGSAIRWLALLPLLAAQFVALSVYLPRALARAELRAVELTGDPEVFLSAMAGLYRFSAAPVSNALLHEIERRYGIAADRILGLLAERTAPVADRYPTSGSYLTTGL